MERQDGGFWNLCLRYPLPTHISRESRLDPTILVSNSEANLLLQNLQDLRSKPNSLNRQNRLSSMNSQVVVPQWQRKRAQLGERHMKREAKQRVYSVGTQSLGDLLWKRLNGYVKTPTSRSHNIAYNQFPFNNWKREKILWKRLA